MAKYFFLSEGWTVGRIWESGGLWNETAWRRKPQIQQLSLSIDEADERLQLYQVEDAILMVEVKPGDNAPPDAIGQVVLKRLMDAEKVLELLCTQQFNINQSNQNAEDDRAQPKRLNARESTQ